jgi:hypothetical protein
MPMDERSDERHHVCECPEAGDAAIKRHGGQSIVLHDAEECVDGNCAYEYTTCEISSGNKPKLPSVSTSSDQLHLITSQNEPSYAKHMDVPTSIALCLKARMLRTKAIACWISAMKHLASGLESAWKSLTSEEEVVDKEQELIYRPLHRRFAPP